MNDKIKAAGFVITRVFDAPREKVWQAWTDPAYAKQWWGPKGFTAPSIDIDLRVGGKYLFCMRGPMTPGGEEKDFWSTGEYLEIVPLEKLVVTDSFADEKGNVVSADYYGMDGNWPRVLKVIVTLEELGPDRMKLTLHYPELTGVKEKDLDDMRQGWNQSLDKLAAMAKAEVPR